jgi:hypothetical protein
MDNLRSLLNKITNKDLPYAKLCRVRQKVVNENGSFADLVYNIEPIDSDGFIDKNAFKLDSNNNQVRDTSTVIGMNDDELKLSKANWIYNARLTAITDVDQESVESNSTGIYQLPELNSDILAIPITDTDWAIVMISKVKEVKIQSEAGSIIVKTDVLTGEKNTKIQDTDIFKVNTDKKDDLSFVISDYILQKNGDNYIKLYPGSSETTSNAISIMGIEDDSRTIIASKNLIALEVTQNYALGTDGLLKPVDGSPSRSVFALSDNKFLMGNNTYTFKQNILNQNVTVIDKIIDALTKVDVQLTALGQPGILTDIAGILTAKSNLETFIDGLFE